MIAGRIAEYAAGVGQRSGCVAMRRASSALMRRDPSRRRLAETGTTPREDIGERTTVAVRDAAVADRVVRSGTHVESAVAR